MNAYYRSGGARNGAAPPPRDSSVLDFLVGAAETWFSEPPPAPPPPPRAAAADPLLAWIPAEVPEEIVQVALLALGFFALVLAATLAYYSVVCSVRLTRWAFRMAWRLAVILLVVSAVFFAVAVVAPWAAGALGLGAGSGGEGQGAWKGAAPSPFGTVRLTVNERGESVRLPDWGRHADEEAARARRETSEWLLGRVFGETLGHSVASGEAVNWTWVGLQYGAAALGRGVSALGSAALGRASAAVGGLFRGALPQRGGEGRRRGGAGRDEL